MSPMLIDTGKDPIKGVIDFYIRVINTTNKTCGILVD